MKAYKIRALLYLDFMLFRNAKWRFMEFFYFPISTLIIWGLFSIFVKDMALEAGIMVVVVNIFWSFAQIAQSAINMQMNEDSWSGSMKQILVTGISEFEYLSARIISSVTVSVIIMALMLSIAHYGFHLAPIAANLHSIMMLSALTLVAAIGLAVFVAAAIFLFGIEYGFIAWSILQIFVLLSAPFYPVEIFPGPVQAVSWAMPFTAVFENVRHLVSFGTISESLLATSAITSLVYFFVSFPVFYLVFRHAKRSGRLVRMS